MLRERGVGVDDADADRWVVAPGPVRAVDVVIEPDLSNAAPFLALAAVSGGPVTVRDWPRETTQAGDLLREILAAMGCRVTLDDDGLTVRGTGTLHGVDLDLHDAGELAPAVAALCALADSPSHLRGIAHIRGHETDRLAALADRADRPRGRRHRARGRAEPAARHAPRRGVPHLRRPPDGARRRDPRRGRWTGCSSRTSPPRRRPSPTSRRSGRRCWTRSPRGERPVRRARPGALRATAPPHPTAHQGAADVRRRRGRVRGHGGPGALHPHPGRPHGDRDEVAPPRPQGRHRRRPGPGGRRHLRRRRLPGPHRRGGRARDGAATDRGRRRPRRADHRGQRQPARRGHRARRPRAAAPPHRPGPGRRRSTPGCSRCCA